MLAENLSIFVSFNPANPQALCTQVSLESPACPFNGNFETDNCKLDSGCTTDPVLNREIANNLGVTTPLKWKIPTVSGIF